MMKVLRADGGFGRSESNIIVIIMAVVRRIDDEFALLTFLIGIRWTRGEGWKGGGDGEGEVRKKNEGRKVNLCGSKCTAKDV